MGLATVLVLCLIVYPVGGAILYAIKESGDDEALRRKNIRTVLIVIGVMVVLMIAISKLSLEGVIVVQVLGLIACIAALVWVMKGGRPNGMV